MGDGAFLTTKATAEDVGTRYRHLADLLDLWGDGLVVVKRTFESYPNVKDQARIKQLEGAIKLLEAYMDQVSNRAGQQMAFNKMLDANVPTKQVLDEIRKDRKAAAEAKAAKGSEDVSTEKKETGRTDSNPEEPEIAT